MKERILYRISISPYRIPVSPLQIWLPCSLLLQEGSGGLLALACYGNLGSAGSYTGTLFWYLLDIESGVLVKETSTSQILTDLNALHLANDASTGTWLVGSLEFSEETASPVLVVRPIREDENGQLMISTPIFEDQANDMAGIGPIFAMQANAKHCILLYRKPDLDYVSTPEICLAQIDLTTGHVEQSVRDNAESVLVCLQEDTALLLALVLQIGGVSFNGQINITEVTNDWDFSAIGYSRDFHTEKWSHNFNLRVGAGHRTTLSGMSDFEWLGINAAAIPGPIVQQTRLLTFVVGMTMMDIFDREGYGHTSEEASWIAHKVQTLLCIGADGKLIQKCADSIGLCLQLCQIGPLTVGVDLVQGQWRLWNWFPLSETSFQKLVWLDQYIHGVHVLAGKGKEKNDVGYFWLIEEESELVRISKYDAFTLMKIDPGVTLPGVHLIEPQIRSGSLDWHTSVHALIYQDTLLFLGIDTHDQLVLYQVK